MTSPRVSVVLPAHNAEATVVSAVRSVLGQTFDDIELIAVNDASSDATGQLLDRLAAGDARMRVLHNERRMERGQTRNRALEEARGEFVAIMDADDVSLPRRIERQVAYLDRHPAVALLGGWGYEIDSAGEPISLLLPPATDAEIRARMPRSNPFIHSSVMYLRSAALEVGGYDPHLTASEDQDLEWRLLAVGEGAILPEVLVLRRLDWAREVRLGRYQRTRSLRVRWSNARLRAELGPGDYAVLGLACMRLLIPSALDVAFRRMKRRLYRAPLPEEAAEWFRLCNAPLAGDQPRARRAGIR